MRVATLAALILSLLAPSRVFAQTASLRQELLKDWVEMKETMRKLAEAMPAEKYTFKTTAPQRDFGQQVVHVATANVMNLGFLRGQAQPPTIDRTATSRAQAIQAMDASFDYGTALLREQTDASLLEIVQTNRFLGPSSRARVIYFLLGHSWDIYGQMVVYLRLNGGVPPASQRP
jgi:hypothetical protein